ncbi:MAG TPA: phosphatidylglycerophosphatase A [Candidatus Limnocylindria bacterium]|nr:phosphatidylglycerophosphatase A [Candidatus Limnocylindria bacterium]
MTSFQQRIVLLSATGAGAGYFPLFPGTVGTLVAVPFSLALNRLAAYSIGLAGITLVAAIFCAIWLSNKAGKILQQKDPRVIVIDEIVGFLLANFAAPNRATVLLTSFMLFRFFDIAKVFPASRLEKLPGGSGIVLDDIMAGIYTFTLVQLLVFWEIL